MISLARLAIDRAAMGLSVDSEIASIPPFQWAIYWEELASLCPSAIAPNPVRQRNALRVELLPDNGPRCSRKSPDGRGLVWLLSGGESLAYGRCEERGCPRAR